MPVLVSFLFRPGLRPDLLSNVQLCGFWDAAGQPTSLATTVIPMAPSRDDTGCPIFQAQASFDAASVGQTLQWTLRADGPDYVQQSLVFPDATDSSKINRSFLLGADNNVQVHDLTVGRTLGANLITQADGTTAVRFAVYAPNAQSIDLVLGDPAIGYIADDGTGGREASALTQGPNGIWTTILEPGTSPLVGTPYMYRIKKTDGSIAYRTDLFSRAQIGSGDCDPAGGHCNGPPEHIDGTKSCSLVCDPDHILDDDGTLVSADAFWAGEFDGAPPLPTDIQDLIIYELHVGALGFGRAGPGRIDDAIAFIPYLVELGVNAVELLPIAEFQGDIGWGYSTSHFCAIEESAGGADRLKHFVRGCHRKGIAVILDVVYNHYDGNAERAEWMYDTNDHTKNFCYWYKGQPSDYADPTGGYIDNISTGFGPGFGDGMVRQLFISSAAQFVTDCHIDGFRVDQTTSIHAYPVLHANGAAAYSARAAGGAFLRQWAQTLRLIKPPIFLIAEDYSGWPAMTRPYVVGTDGLGFDAVWYSDFYHNLVDFGDGGDNVAKLVRNSGYGDGRALDMGAFADALWASGGGKICYNESHDEAGNSKNSARTICLAVNNAPLFGGTRTWAEARVRVAAGLALLAAGTPMFFMGEEVGAQRPYRYNDFLDHREDFVGLKARTGANLFRYYKDLIALSRGSTAIRSRNLDVLFTHDDNRLIAFHRVSDAEEIVVVASFNMAAFDQGYHMSNPCFAGHGWREIFNSDAAIYGGAGIGNFGNVLQASAGDFNPIIPATGLLVFRREA